MKGGGEALVEHAGDEDNKNGKIKTAGCFLKAHRLSNINALIRDKQSQSL